MTNGATGTEAARTGSADASEREAAERVVVLTGAAGGIGSATTAELARAGYTVFATDVEEPVAGPGGLDGAVVPRRLAVDDSAAVDALFAEVREYCARHGATLHGVVNVAGVFRSGRVLDLGEDEWRALFDVNALGVFLVCRAGLALMREQCGRDRGNARGIVTVASNSAVVPRASMAAYAASKAAASHFTRSLGLEAAEFGVRCNVVDPGTTRTPMVTDGWRDAGAESTVIGGVPEDFKAGIPLGRIAEPEDIAGVVAFLLGDAARHMTLQEVVVDGGATQR